MSRVPWSSARSPGWFVRGAVHLAGRCFAIWRSLGFSAAIQRSPRSLFKRSTSLSTVKASKPQRTPSCQPAFALRRLEPDSRPLLRFLSGILIVSVMGLSALWATGFVNVLGSFVIGLFAALTGPDGRLLVSPAARQFVMGGICGGFTTFSAMSLDTFILLLQGDIPLAGLYLVLVVALSLVAAWVGHMLAARLNE